MEEDDEEAEEDIAIGTDEEEEEVEEEELLGTQCHSSDENGEGVGKNITYAVPAHSWELQANQGEEMAARTFVKESGMIPKINLNTIKLRQDIRQSIIDGNCISAINQINILNGNILKSSDACSDLLFKLNKQQVIEKIRGGEINGALEYVQQEIGPMVRNKPEFMEEMEEVLLLVAFDTLNVAPKACQHLMNLTERYRLAYEANLIILHHLEQSIIDQISIVEKERIWVEHKLRDWGATGIPQFDYTEINSGNGDRIGNTIYADDTGSNARIKI